MTGGRGIAVTALAGVMALGATGCGVAEAGLQVGASAAADPCAYLTEAEVEGDLEVQVISVDGGPGGCTYRIGSNDGAFLQTRVQTDVQPGSVEARLAEIGEPVEALGERAHYSWQERGGALSVLTGTTLLVVQLVPKIDRTHDRAVQGDTRGKLITVAKRMLGTR